MMTIDLSTVAYEAAVNGMAALTFALVLMPLSYIIGVRDGRRNAMSRGIALGYQQALNSLREYGTTIPPIQPAPLHGAPHALD